MEVTSPHNASLRETHRTLTLLTYSILYVVPGRKSWRPFNVYLMVLSPSEWVAQTTVCSPYLSLTSTFWTSMVTALATPA